MNQIRRILKELVRIADYQDEVLREYRRLRGGSAMDNRGIVAERYIDERQYEAMRAVAAARLQREAVGDAAVKIRRAGALRGLLGAFRRVLSPARTDETSRVPVRAEVHRP